MVMSEGVIVRSKKDILKDIKDDLKTSIFLMEKMASLIIV